MLELVKRANEGTKDDNQFLERTANADTLNAAVA